MVRKLALLVILLSLVSSCKQNAGRDRYADNYSSNSPNITILSPNNGSDLSTKKSGSITVSGICDVADVLIKTSPVRRVTNNCATNGTWSFETGNLLLGHNRFYVSGVWASEVELNEYFDDFSPLMINEAGTSGIDISLVANSFAVMTTRNSVAVGSQIKARAAFYDEDGVEITINHVTAAHTFTWSVDDEDVATLLQTTGDLINIEGASGGAVVLTASLNASFVDEYGYEGNMQATKALSVTGEAAPPSPYGTNDFTYTINIGYSPVTDSARSVKVQSDGKIIAVGAAVAPEGGNDFAISRYNADGSLDDTFGTEGKVTTDVSENSSGDTANDVAVQSDGKIVVVGESSNYNDGDFMVFRYNSDGSLDDSFGTGGKVITHVGRTDQATRVMIQNDGKIVITGTTCIIINQFSCEKATIAIRYNDDGSLDNSYGSGGKAIFTSSITYGYSGTMQSDQKVLIAGVTFGGSLAAMRINTNGTLDTDFGVMGIATTGVGAIGGSPGYGSVAVDGNGKIVLASGVYMPSTSSNDIAIVRYNSDGSLDTTLDGHGIVLLDLGAQDRVSHTAIQSDGKIVIAGGTQTNVTFNFVIRYNADGSIDEDFGDDGTLYLNNIEGITGSQFASAAIQSDGKILALADINQDFQLNRYDSSGALDEDFGTAGKVITDFSMTGSSDFLRVLALQSDGKIVSGGGTNGAGSASDFLITRHNADGTIDDTFGTEGWVNTAFELSNSLMGIAVQDDDKILASGTSYTPQGDAYYVAARYNTDGSLDTSFGTDGKALIDMTMVSHGGNANCMLLQSDGKVVLGGYVPDGDWFSYFALARLNTNGSLDTSFDVDGKVYTDVGGGYLYSMALQPDGKIVAGGYVSNSTDDFAVVRYNNDGSLDTDFGTDGIVLTNDIFAADSWDYISVVAVQEDGKIVAAGYSTDEEWSDVDFAVVRYNTDGSLDTDFGTGGKVVTDLGGSDDEAYALALQTDGKIVLAGYSNSTDENYDGAVVRYNTDGSLDTSFGTDGKYFLDFEDGSYDTFNSIVVQPNGEIVLVGETDANGSSDGLLLRF